MPESVQLSAGDPAADLNRSPPPSRARVGALVMSAVLHLVLVLALVRAFAPNFSSHMARPALEVFSIDLPPPPSSTPQQDDTVAAAGDVGAAGPRATPAALPAPRAKVVLAERAAPPVAGSGTQAAAGASAAGTGSGSGPQSGGSGSGGSGSGIGGGLAGPAVKLSGDIKSTRDYPPGGRAKRQNDHVVVVLRVGVDGRVRGCTIQRASADPEADRITCQLATERFRFRPATDRNGQAIESFYGWRQRWYDPRAKNELHFQALRFNGNSMITPVILCGGSGTRLWPRSRADNPKPFLPLVGERTLFEQALDRCPRGEGFASPVVVTGAAHLAHVEAQLGADPDAAIIVEPAAKNTAAAIALAALRLPQDAVLLVCPSDHHIGDPGAFAIAARAAADLARQDWLVAFGIEPTHPETGYGYLKRGEPVDTGGWRVARFVEKPDLARAAAFLAEGGYAWNGGIFAFRAGAFLAELALHRPALFEAVRAAVAGGHADGRRFHPDAGAFAAIESESVDYAVMENTTRAAMVPARMAWSDIGNWQALHEARERDASGNAVMGPAELVDCRNVLVETDGPRVSVIGLENVIVVVDRGEVLVTTAEGAQKVGKLGGATNQ